MKWGFRHQKTVSPVIFLFEDEHKPLEKTADSYPALYLLNQVLSA